MVKAVTKLLLALGSPACRRDWACSPSQRVGDVGSDRALHLSFSVVVAGVFPLAASTAPSPGGTLGARLSHP